MSFPIDAEQARFEAILDFTSLRAKSIAEAPAKELTAKEASAASTQAKVNAARLHALKEIEQYRAIMEKTRTEVDKLCLFESVGGFLFKVAIDDILSSLIEPVLKGTIPKGMPEELYKTMRKDMYKTLINRYVDDIGNEER